MAGHIKGCKFMKNDNNNDDTIEDNGYDGFHETEEDNFNSYLNLQEIASNFEVLPRAYPILLRNGLKVTPNWLHYLEIAKFGKILRYCYNVISNYYFFSCCKCQKMVLVIQLAMI
jgi:hypothetical protein